MHPLGAAILGATYSLHQTVPLEVIHNDGKVVTTLKVLLGKRTGL
jgi:hypothetical protein